jgi:hypothetical protein
LRRDSARGTRRDFGCDSGASTAVLARLFHGVQLVGVELEELLLNLAKLRAARLGLRNAEFLLSPSPVTLPHRRALALNGVIPAAYTAGRP